MKPPTQNAALRHRASKLLSSLRERAEQNGASIDFDLEYLCGLLASNGCCTYCKLPLSFETSLDHRIPIARGGSHCAYNLVVCCTRCNSIKGQLKDGEFGFLMETLRGMHPVARADVELRLIAGGRRYFSKKKKKGIR